MTRIINAWVGLIRTDNALITPDRSLICALGGHKEVHNLHRNKSTYMGIYQ